MGDQVRQPIGFHAVAPPGPAAGLDADTVRVVSWNVMQGGGTRKQRIVNQLTEWQADVAVLTEYRHPNGADFQAMLGDAGFGHQLTGPDESGGYAGTLIASRHPLRPGGVRLDVPEGSARWLHAVIDGIGWDVVGCLIPAASGAKGKDRKNSFWDAIITNAAQLGSRPCLITGDFNTGRHHIDETGATFHASDRFERMLDSGWVDGFRALHGDISAPTWWSPGYNNGFRLDHAFLSPGSPPPVACQPSTRPATRSAAPPRPACPTMPP